MQGPWMHPRPPRQDRLLYGNCAAHFAGSMGLADKVMNPGLIELDHLRLPKPDIETAG